MYRRIILQRILYKFGEYEPESFGSWNAVVDTVMNLRVPWNAWNSLGSRASVGFSETTRRAGLSKTFGSNIDSGTGSPDWRVPWFSSVPPSRRWNCISIRPRPSPSKSFAIFHSSAIRRCVISTLKASLKNRKKWALLHEANCHVFTKIFQGLWRWWGLYIEHCSLSEVYFINSTFRQFTVL